MSETADLSRHDRMEQCSREIESVLEKYHCSMNVDMMDDAEEGYMAIIIVPNEENEEPSARLH